MDMYKNRKNPLLKKLRGYLKYNREKFMLLYMGELSQEEFIVYDFGVAITDWDKGHEETYGTFYATNSQIGDILYLSGSRISRIKKSLIAKGFLVVREDGRIIAKDFEKWQLRKRVEMQI